MKVTIGLIISHGFPVPSAFVVGFSHLLNTVLTGAGNRLLPADLQVDAARVMFSHAFPTDVARNEVVRLFLNEDDGDYLLFLDCDMQHPPDTLHRLVGRECDVVTGRYVMRKPPFFSVAMRKVGPGPNDYQAIDKLEPVVQGLMPVDAGGAGALLMSRRVLQEVGQRTGGDWFRYQDGPAGRRTVSEDMWFYEQAKACGFQPYLDADLSCKHIAQFEVDETFHAPYAEAYRRQQEAAV